MPAGLERDEALSAYELYKEWTSPNGTFKGARAIVIQVQHANPFFDDSYSVNSANVGPYGDAIIHDFIPYIEAAYRGVGEGWARALFGGSTGGWESIGVQVLYPDQFNGAFAYGSRFSVLLWQLSRGHWWGAPPPYSTPTWGLEHPTSVLSRGSHAILFRIHVLRCAVPMTCGMMKGMP